jgi:hypothetical protein
MNFAQTAKQNATMKLTENGAHAYSTTKNPVLDLFAEIGSLRPRSEGDILMKFSEAFNYDRTLATKMFFYAGNIRGGLGERRTFRIILKYLANTYPSIVRDNIALIPHFNRWDSIFTLVGTACEKDMWQVITEQLMTDMAGVKRSNTSNKPVGISLLAKWMPTETAHNKDTIALAKRAIRKLGVTPRQYRKMLSALRKHLNIVERLMSANKWDEVEYPAVPSYAMKNYRKAFGNHDSIRFAEYIESLKKGEKKINASTLYPYDLVHQCWGMRYSSVDDIVEAQWKALPNYVEGENNVLVMADVSGSMTWGNGRPIETSIGLATYFAQHNKGDYHNLYMTFTDRPHFISLDGCDTLASAVKKVMNTDVGYGTNLDRAFDHILNHAVAHNIKPEDMPSALIVVSDMEIDPYFRGRRSLDFVQTQKMNFARFGYQLPKLVMWNVEARNDTFLSHSEDVLLVSGQATSTFKQLCGDLNGVTAWDLMLKTLNDPMYDCIKV